MVMMFSSPSPIPRHDDLPMDYSTRTPTIAQISDFIQSIFPTRKGDTPFRYHTPRSFSVNPQTVTASRVVLGITPTPGFYAALSSSTPAPVAFLHRPWNLDRRRVPRHATVLSCHRGFDEALTVGNNVALASGLGMDISRSAVIRGYKGDPERTIGIVGPVGAIGRAALRARIEAEFSSVEGAFGFDQEDSTDTARVDVEVIAIMNAFHPAEVERVATNTLGLGLVPSATECRRILYLTGATRELGLRAALDKGMSVVCVGHLTCEEWGVRYLAKILRGSWPSVQIDEILEDENRGDELEEVDRRMERDVAGCG